MLNKISILSRMINFAYKMHIQLEIQMLIFSSFVIYFHIRSMRRCSVAESVKKNATEDKSSSDEQNFQGEIHPEPYLLGCVHPNGKRIALCVCVCVHVCVTLLNELEFDWGYGRCVVIQDFSN